MAGLSAWSRCMRAVVLLCQVVRAMACSLGEQVSEHGRQVEASRILSVSPRAWAFARRLGRHLPARSLPPVYAPYSRCITSCIGWCRASATKGLRITCPAPACASTLEAQPVTWSPRRFLCSACLSGLPRHWIARSTRLCRLVYLWWWQQATRVQTSPIALLPVRPCEWLA